MDKKIDEIVEKTEKNDLLGFVKTIDDLLRREGETSERVQAIEESILQGFERNEKTLADLLNIFKIVMSQLDSPLKTNLDYDRMYPEKIKVSNLSEVKIPEEFKVKRRDWYKDLDLEPLIKEINKQYSVPLEDIRVGSEAGAFNNQPTMVIPGEKGYRIYLSSIVIANHSSAGTLAEVKSGSTYYRSPAPVNINVGGAVVSLPTPLPGEPGEAWYFKVSPAVNTVYCSMVGFRKAA